MKEYDVVIVGGGPAGSSCAWGLKESGKKVLIIDRAEFPREKTCAGWITPPVLKMLSIDISDYQGRQILQPITGFKTSVLGHSSITTSYNKTVSYGIRRSEFDHYLLRRCGAQLMTGTPVRELHNDGNHWIVNNEIKAHVLIGAGGNFCPVTRLAGFNNESVAPLVTAQEVEFELNSEECRKVGVTGPVPQLFFCPDLNGYGWCFRKGNYLNIGLGHTNPEQMKVDLSRLIHELSRNDVLNIQIPERMHGHAYRLACRQNFVVFDRLLLIGDSAGLANPASGEGIRPAVESGLYAAKVLEDSRGEYGVEQLRAYEDWVRHRFRCASSHQTTNNVISSFRNSVGRLLLRSRWFSRHIVLDRWFFQEHIQENDC